METKLQVRVPAGAKAQWEARAREEGVVFSTWVRRALDAATLGKAGLAPKDARFQEQLRAIRAYYRHPSDEVSLQVAVDVVATMVEMGDDPLPLIRAKGAKKGSK